MLDIGKIVKATAKTVGNKVTKQASSFNVTSKMKNTWQNMKNPR
jgi:hypothetical protein